MATNPNDIQLSPEHKRLIAERADQNGKPWRTVLNDALGKPTEFDELEDTEFLAFCIEELEELKQKYGDEPPSLEDVRRILSKVPGSLADDIIADRVGR